MKSKPPKFVLDWQAWLAVQAGCAFACLRCQCRRSRFTAVGCQLPCRRHAAAARHVSVSITRRPGGACSKWSQPTTKQASPQTDWHGHTAMLSIQHVAALGHTLASMCAAGHLKLENHELVSSPGLEGPPMWQDSGHAQHLSSMQVAHTPPQQPNKSAGHSKVSQFQQDEWHDMWPASASHCLTLSCQTLLHAVLPTPLCDQLQLSHCSQAHSRHTWQLRLKHLPGYTTLNRATAAVLEGWRTGSARKEGGSPLEHRSIESCTVTALLGFNLCTCVVYTGWPALLHSTVSSAVPTVSSARSCTAGHLLCWGASSSTVLRCSFTKQVRWERHWNADVLVRLHDRTAVNSGHRSPLQHATSRSRSACWGVWANWAQHQQCELSPRGAAALDLNTSLQGPSRYNAGRPLRTAEPAVAWV